MSSHRKCSRVIKCELSWNARALSLSCGVQSFITSISIPHSRLLYEAMLPKQQTDHHIFRYKFHFHWMAKYRWTAGWWEYNTQLYFVRSNNPTSVNRSHWAMNVMARVRLLAIPLKRMKTIACGTSRGLKHTVSGARRDVDNCCGKVAFNFKLIDWLKCESHLLRNQAEIFPMWTYCEASCLLGPGIRWTSTKSSPNGTQPIFKKTKRIFVKVSAPQMVSNS